MKTRKVYGDQRAAAKRIFETLYEIMVEASLYALDSEQVALDYMDVQAIRRLLEKVHDHLTGGMKSRCRGVYDILLSAIQRDFESGQKGDIILVRPVLADIMEVLDLFYSLHPSTPLDTQLAQTTEIEYWVDPDTGKEKVEIRLPDGEGDVVDYDDIIHHPLWLIVYQDIKQHERMGIFSEVRERFSLQEWFRHVIQNHYFIRDNVPDSIHQGARVLHHPEA